MKIKLLCTALLLSIGLLACGKEGSNTPNEAVIKTVTEQTSNDVSSEVSEKEKQTSDNLDVELLVYDYAKEKPSDESSQVVNYDEKIFCLTANCSAEEITQYYFAAVELANEGLITNAMIQLKSNDFILNFMVNGEKTILLSSEDGGKNYNLGWNLEPSQDGDIALEKNELTELYNRAVDGETVGL